MCTAECACDHGGDEQSVPYQAYKHVKEPEWNSFGRTKTNSDDFVQFTWAKGANKNILQCFDRS